MRRGQPTLLFSFTIVVGIVRVFAYAGMPIGQTLSLSTIVHFVSIHLLGFAYAAFLVAALSKATATRAAQIALYAQFALFLAPFVDVGAGLSLSAYEATYLGLFGGSPGSIAAALAYGAIIAWGVWDASMGLRTARSVLAAVAVLAGAVGLPLLAVPWPASLLFNTPAWGMHLGLAMYYGLLAALFLAAAVGFANRTVYRKIRRGLEPVSAVGFALLPLIGIAGAGRLAFPPNGAEPLQRLQIEGPYIVGSAVVAAALWVQWRLIRSPAWGPLRLEAAAVAKVVALAVALVLGTGPLVVAGLAASAAWLGAYRGWPLLAVVASIAVLVGNLTAVPVDFTDVSFGPIVLAVPLDPIAAPSIGGVVAAVAVGTANVALGALTSRTSA